MGEEEGKGEKMLLVKLKKEQKRNNEKEEGIEEEKRESYGELDVEGDENKVEIRRDSKGGGEKRGIAGKIRIGKNW